MSHDWKETGKRDFHVSGIICRYPPKLATYVKCTKCGAVGFRRLPSQIVYTWDQEVTR